MKAGRNDPCPCGSGKKYKKCCMEQDLAVERSGMRVVSERPQLKQKTWADFEHLKINDFIEEEFDEDDFDEEETPERFVDPRQISLFGDDEFPPVPQTLIKSIDDAIDVAASNRRWDEFKRANYETKIALFLKTLDEKKLMDHEMAFEMLSMIQSEASQHNELDRFFSLVAKLEHDLPDVYEADAGYYLDWKIVDAVFHSRHDEVVSLLKEFAPQSAKDIDLFNNVVDMLAYHGYQAPLLEAFKVGWKDVQHSSKIVPWGINEFAERAVDYLIFEYIESHQEINPFEKELIKTAETFIPELLRDEFANFVKLASGKTKIEWTLTDFDPNPKSPDGKSKKKQVANNLYDLSLEFISFLRWEQNVPFCKGRLIRYQLLDYFYRRSRRELVAQPSMLDKIMNKGKQNPKKQPIPKHILCPDAATLDIFLSGLMHFLNPQYYKLAATIELIPAWLKFLETRQLLDEKLRNEAFQDIRANLIPTISEIYNHAIRDPFLRKNLERYWQA